MKANPGDKIKIKTQQKIYTGFLIERPELAEDKHLVIKLESGYNVGIKKEEIEDIEIVERKKEKKVEKEKQIKKDPSKPTVSIISTGGTISSRVDYSTGGVYAAFTAEDLLEIYPEIGKFANIKTIGLMNVMSEDMNPELWQKIAKEVHKELNSESSGVVVTHGTDTMAFTSAALNFMLKDLSQPVALTGSQRSSDRPSSDAFLNLLCSVIWASSEYSGAGIVMHGSMSDNFCLVHPGTKVRKMHTTRRDAFQSINSKPWAKIFPEGQIEASNVVPNRSDQSPTLLSNMEEKVALVKIYPGMDPEILDLYIDKEFEGIVLEATALGHVPTMEERSLLPKIEKAVDKGVVTAITSQCLHGRVHPYVYSNLRKVSSRGAIYCEDMLPETAYVKLAWLLGNYSSQKAKELMKENLRGEISPRTEVLNS